MSAYTVHNLRPVGPGRTLRHASVNGGLAPLCAPRAYGSLVTHIIPDDITCGRCRQIVAHRGLTLTTSDTEVST